MRSRVGPDDSPAAMAIFLTAVIFIVAATVLFKRWAFVANLIVVSGGQCLFGGLLLLAPALTLESISDVRVTVPAGCTRFKASVGIDDEVGSNGSVVFQVFAGATQIYASPTLTGTSATVQVDVDITGASTLRVFVTNGGDNINYDHADWADARIECS